MAIVKPTINSLDFDGIRTSIINYIKTKPEFLDYDFQGSAINSLVDVLAYNTLYYGFYSNMIASEGFLDTAKLESSIVSLCKPLGIVVPGKASSKINLQVQNEQASSIQILAYNTTFSGSLNGINYNFYSIEDKTIIPGATDNIILYESKNPVLDLELNVDLATQTAFLGTTEIDINTISVKVKNSINPEGKVWERKTAIDTSIAEDSEIYFIERTASGFVLVFGKKSVNDFAEISVGKDITQEDTVIVSYLVSSGSGANNITNINVTPLTILTEESTYGGTDGPNLETIKSLAPKFFASNDRAVTKDDYYGILFTNNKIQDANEINIWGGEEAEPISHGRVFISMIDISTEEDPEVKEILNLLKNKSVITVIPEFVLPVELVLNAAFNIKLNKTFGTNTTNLSASIKSVLATEYGKTFNFNFKSEEAGVVIRQITPAILQTSMVANSTNIKAPIRYSISDRIIYYKNEFFPSVTIGGALFSDSIPTSYSSFGIILADFPTEFVDGEPTVGKIVGRFNDGNLNQTVSPFGYDIDELGFIDYKSGIVILYEQFLSKITNTATYGIYSIPRYPDNVIGKNEVIMSLNVTGIQYS